jgi:phosphoglycolate phosphatase-like HAD superfamily hydrolase
MSDILKDFQLIIFDLDGTLRDMKTGAILPGVDAFFEARGSDFQFAIVTNQGGVGLRYWMERDGFGDPAKYPSEAGIRAEVGDCIDSLPTDEPIKVYMCFAYQSKHSGKWSPTPEGKLGDSAWNPENRKPAPGMLFQAMSDAGAHKERTLFVGDSDEDEGAAHAAGVRFMWAEHFFNPDMYGIGAV